MEIHTAITFAETRHIAEESDRNIKGIDTYLQDLGEFLRANLDIKPFYQATILGLIFIIGILMIFWGLNPIYEVNTANGMEVNKNSSASFPYDILTSELPNSYITLSIASLPVFKPHPSVVNGFIGRDDILGSMRQYHLNEASESNSPRITVLSGLGGSGKTQTALKFARQFEEKYATFTIV